MMTLPVIREPESGISSAIIFPDLAPFVRNRSRGGEEGDRSMFSDHVFVTKLRQMAEKWTSPRPPRERLPLCCSSPRGEAGEIQHDDFPRGDSQFNAVCLARFQILTANNRLHTFAGTRYDHRLYHRGIRNFATGNRFGNAEVVEIPSR